RYRSLVLPPLPRSTLSPYTTLFRSGLEPLAGEAQVDAAGGPVTRPRAAPCHLATARPRPVLRGEAGRRGHGRGRSEDSGFHRLRSEEHTSELQSRENLVCRLLLEKK